MVAAASFDAVVMGFGMNHMPDPAAVAREAFRVLRPGGRFAFTVWAAPQPETGFGIMLDAIEACGVPGVTLPPAPPYFRFADPAEVAGLLTAAGFRAPRTEIVPQAWHHSTPDGLFDAFSTGAVRATAMLRIQPEAARARIRQRTRAAVSALAGAGRRA